jgi:lipid A 4'-phosphatase
MFLTSRYHKARVFKWDWLVFSFCLIFFSVFPNFDLLVASLTWSDEGKFEFAENFWVRFLYLVFAKIHFAYLGLLLCLWISQWIKKAPPIKHQIRVHALFLLTALILGPGLVVNYGLKENWGRARPREVIELGGANHYTPPLVMSAECKGNCSFVSGHASGAFFILSLIWVFRKRRWFWLGIGLGGLVGMGRILQGGHFVSDVVFAFWAVYFSSLLAAMTFNLSASSANDNSRILS